MPSWTRTLGKVGIGLAIAISWSIPTATSGEEAPPSVIIYSKDNIPKAPNVEELPLKESVSQYGITWTFEKPAPVGRFLTGDYYVVGSVTVKEISPKVVLGKDVPESELDKSEGRKISADKRIRNGSMLNPPARPEVAYDSGIKSFFRPELITTPPYALKPGDTLVSTISLKQGEKPSFLYHAGGIRAKQDCALKVAALLTCVATPPPLDAFRPGYCDRVQTIYLARNLRRDLLPNLAQPPKQEKTRGWENIPDPVRFAEIFRRPWLNTCFFDFEQAMENMPAYGRWVGQAVGDAGLLLCMDFKPEEKEPLLLNLVQVGIDYWSMVKSGHPGWQAWGGHGSGRKFPVVFGGIMLGDEQMATPTKAFPKVDFGEDNQTRYGEAWHGAQVVFAGHSGIQSASGKPERSIWGPYEHLHPSQWDKGGQKNKQSDAYRRCCTSNCWVSQALALRLLKAESHWNHDPFFDYVDRWMFQDEKELHRDMPAGVHDMPGDFARQGNTSEAWVKEMWAKYRTGPGMPPTDGWTKKKEGPRINAADYPVLEADPKGDKAKSKTKDAEDNG